jgi:phosphoribosylformylglycinamidine synthase subunit PurQ / glutaminase
VKSAIILFPGTNRERDMAAALQRVSGEEPEIVWHEETALPPGLDLIVLPGGFAHGDYLRPGAMAARSPVMREVAKRAEAGALVLGVCNGFQALCEAGLLPGALMRNSSLKFVCREVRLEVANAGTPFTRLYGPSEVIRVPVAHHDGNYFADEATLDRLEGDGRVAFRYAEPVDGSARAVAGVLNQRGNVLGMMPHPERRIEAAHGGSDGRRLFESLVGALVES